MYATNMYFIFLKVEGSNRKCPGDIHLHCASRGVGEGGKTKHIVHRTYFVDGDYVVDLGMRMDNISVVVACGCSVGLMAAHMAFVGGDRLGQMGVRQISCEMGDGFQFGALGEGKQERGGCWGTK